MFPFFRKICVRNGVYKRSPQNYILALQPGEKMGIFNKFRKDKEAKYVKKEDKGLKLTLAGKHEKAIEFYEKIIQINPQDADAWCLKADSLVRLRRFDEAVECFGKAVEIDPLLANAWANKGRSLNALGRFDEALFCLDKATELESNDSGRAYSLFHKGNSLSHLKRFNEAVQCYDEVIEIEPDDEDAWCNKGSCLDSLGRYNEALQCYEKAIEINENHQDAWKNKGILLLKEKRFEEAMYCFDEILFFIGNERLIDGYVNKGAPPEVWYLKGICYDSLKQWEKAAWAYWEFTKVAPAQYPDLVEKARDRLLALRKEGKV